MGVRGPPRAGLMARTPTQPPRKGEEEGRGKPPKPLCRTCPPAFSRTAAPLHPRPDRVIIAKQEFVIVAIFVAEAELVADRVGDGGDRLRLGVAQHPLQRLQLEHAVNVELRLGEGEAALRRRLGVEQVDGELLARRADHPGAGEQVADPHLVLVEHREEQEQPGPAEPGERHQGAARALGGVVGEEGDRQIEFDLAHQVARDHPVGGQPLAAARDHAQARSALAEGRRARAHLHQDEIAVPEHEIAEQPDHRHDLAALEADRGEGGDGEQGQADQYADHDQPVDEERRDPLADVGELEAEVDALGRDQAAALGRFEVAQGGEVRHRRAAAGRNKRARARAWSGRWRSAPCR